jgi:pimeloyl-ACP methyl ester carboxylesterase
MTAPTSPSPYTPAFEEQSISAGIGPPLRCCHTSLDHRKPYLAVVLPFGIPAEVCGAAFQRLRAKFNVVTWEGRYILNPGLPFSGSENLAPADYVGDLLAILEALRIKTCTLLGYCSGGGISLVAASQHPAVFPELLLVNGEYQLFRRGHVSTAYQRSIDSFLPAVAGSRESARSIFSTMADVAKASQGEVATELQRHMNTPFSTEERLFRYARTYMTYREFDALEFAPRIPQTTLVVTGRLDEHSNMENSEAVCDRIPQSNLFIDDEGDHYAFCRSGSDTLEAIATYLGV